MDFRIIRIVAGHNDKDTFFDFLEDQSVEKEESEFETLEQVISFLNQQENDNIHLVLYKGAPFTVQGSFKNTSGWGRWIRFNFKKEEENKYGKEVSSTSIRALNVPEFEYMIGELFKAVKSCVESQEVEE